MNAKTEHVVKDAVESVCLLQPEGLVFIFSHRSFQEYFTALFLSLYRGEDTREVLGRALVGHHGDSVASMLHEIDPYLFDKEFVLPNLDIWIAKVGRLKLDTPSGLSKFLRATFGKMEIDTQKGKLASYTVDDDTICGFCARVENIHPDAQIYRRVFESGNPEISDNLDDLLVRNHSKYKKIRDWKDNRTENGRLEISPATDARWLCETKIPARMEAVRKDIIGLRNKIQAGMQARRATMATLLGPLKTPQ